MNDRTTGCRGKNAKEMERNKRRRKEDGEETDRRAYLNSSDYPQEEGGVTSQT